MAAAASDEATALDELRSALADAEKGRDDATAKHKETFAKAKTERGITRSITVYVDVKQILTSIDWNICLCWSRPEK